MVPVYSLMVLNFESYVKNPIVEADEAMIKNALTNLIENAIIYTDKGGVSIVLGEKLDKLILTI